VFEFGKVRFRALEREDLKLLHVWENDSELIMYSRSRPMNFVSIAQLEKQFEDWTKDEKDFRFIVELVDSGEPIGIARLERQDWGNVKSIDVGTYIGRKELWGKGLSRDITVGLMEMAFNQLNAERCQAWSVEYNRRAHKALEACGFKKGGALRETSYVNGRKWSSFHFDILKEEYLNIRTNLLKQALGEKVEEYIKKNDQISEATTTQ
jgi:RimJ/RimL family protein N-acetyltransferase